MDLQTARDILREENCTCVLCREDRIYKSHRRGVAPLMEHLDLGTDLRDFSAADKVVGRATALLYALLGVSRVHALILSQGAADVLAAQKIQYSYETLVPTIRNRAGDGLCPMEQATLEISDPALAPTAIRKTLERLAAKN